jgi:hypothetical protein
MRKVIEIVRCDWCKKEVESKFVRFADKEVDVCTTCLAEIFGRLGDDAPSPTQTPETKGRRKKGAPEPSESILAVPSTLSVADCAAAVVKELGLDMRDAATASALDLAVLDATNEEQSDQNMIDLIRKHVKYRLFIASCVNNNEEKKEDDSITF